MWLKMKNNFLKNKAFTLIECIFAIFILSVISIYTISGINNFLQIQNMNIKNNSKLSDIENTIELIRNNIKTNKPILKEVDMSKYEIKVSDLGELYNIKIFLKDNRDLRNVFGAATTYRFMGQHRNAIDKYSQAISMNSGFAESYLGRGLSYRNLNEYDNAVSDLKTYISKTGAHDGYVALADVYFKMGKNKEAYAIASQGIAKYGNSGILKVLANNILKNKID